MFQFGYNFIAICNYDINTTVCKMVYLHLDTEVPPPSDVKLGNIQAVPELRFKETPQTNGRFKILYQPFIQFRCVFSNSSNYFYYVQWYDLLFFVYLSDFTDFNLKCF
jgi:hypothetical protein